MTALQSAGNARVKAYWSIGRNTKNHADRNFVKNELMLTDGQMGLAIMLSKYSWTEYQNCVSLSAAKKLYNLKQDALKVEKTPTKEEAEASIALAKETIKKNSQIDYDYIDL